MDQNTVWVIAIAALMVGALIGFLFGRSGTNGSREMKLADELDKTQQELAHYRVEVNEHFSKTADLVNNLTQQYQKVHEHLAEGAEVLCRDEKLVASLKQNLNLTHSTAADPKPEAPVDQDQIAPEPSAPLDYAPKSADEPGTLSDRFGLKKETEEPPIDPNQVYSAGVEPKSKSA